MNEPLLVVQPDEELGLGTKTGSEPPKPPPAHNEPLQTIPARPVRTIVFEQRKISCSQLVCSLSAISTLLFGISFLLYLQRQ